MGCCTLCGGRGCCAGALCSIEVGALDMVRENRCMGGHDPPVPGAGGRVVIGVFRGMGDGAPGPSRPTKG